MARKMTQQSQQHQGQLLTGSGHSGRGGGGELAGGGPTVSGREAGLSGTGVTGVTGVTGQAPGGTALAQEP